MVVAAAVVVVAAAVVVVAAAVVAVAAAVVAVASETLARVRRVHGAVTCLQEHDQINSAKNHVKRKIYWLFFL